MTMVETANSRSRTWFIPRSPVWYTTIGVFVLSWLIAPGSVSSSGINAMLPFAAILAIAAIGQTMVIMLRGIDLSVPGMITVSALVSSQVAAQNGNNVVLAIGVVAVIAVIVGVVNGFVITYFKVSPLVVTLAMNAALMGFGLFYTGGTPSRAPDGVASFSLAKTFGLSNTVWMALLLVVVVALAVNNTTWGRQLAATGTNERAARAAGVPVTWIKMSGYVGAALCYAGAGILLAGYVGTPNTNAGTPYLLPAIAAVVVGGTSLAGGKGAIVGTALGALFLSQLDQLVLSMGAPSSTQLIIQAVVVAVAVATQSLDVRQLLIKLRKRPNPVTLGA
jgi:ribose transport system permease protein